MHVIKLIEDLQQKGQQVEKEREKERTREREREKGERSKQGEYFPQLSHLTESF